MSEPKWTPAQRAAIADRGGALLVSAAAGSGKTAVLTERAVRLITDPDRRAAGPHRAGIAPAQPGRAGQQRPPPPADAAAAGPHLHH